MAESTPEKRIQTDWRVVLMLGSISASRPIKYGAISDLPLDIVMNGTLNTNTAETFKLVAVKSRGPTSSYFADWRLNRIDALDALTDAVGFTQEACKTGDLPDVTITAARVAAYADFGRTDPNKLWLRMPRHTDILGDLVQREEVEGEEMLAVFKNASIEDFLPPEAAA